MQTAGCPTSNSNILLRTDDFAFHQNYDTHTYLTFLVLLRYGYYSGEDEIKFPVAKTISGIFILGYWKFENKILNFP